MSCLEFIVNNTNEGFAVDLLDSEPYKILVKNYWRMCRRGFEVLILAHVIFMIIFTYFAIPSPEFMLERFPSNITTEGNSTTPKPYRHSQAYESSDVFYGMFPIWPIFILIYEIICAFAVIFRYHGMLTYKFPIGNLLTYKLPIGFPIGTLLFCFNNLSHISSIAFGAAFIAWYVMFLHATNAHRFLESVAMAFVFGWLHTVNFVKGFKDWNAFTNIVKQIFLKDVTRFIYIYIFVLISFGYAIHVLMIADYLEDPTH